MSDGPHKSLPMSKPWKSVAKRSYETTYADEDVVESFTAALSSDFRMEVQATLLSLVKGIFAGKDNSLKIPSLAHEQLEDAKKVAAGSVFGKNLIGWSQVLISDGHFEANDFFIAIGAAAQSRGHAAIRQISEHILRKRNGEEAWSVTKRLNSALSSYSDENLGRTLLERREDRRPRLRKRTGIEEGIALP